MSAHHDNPVYSTAGSSRVYMKPRDEERYGGNGGRSPGSRLPGRVRTPQQLLHSSSPSSSASHSRNHSPARQPPASKPLVPREFNPGSSQLRHEEDDMEMVLLPTPEMKSIDATLEELTLNILDADGNSSKITGKRHRKLTLVKPCFCQARLHASHPQAPQCPSCGLLLCVATRPSPILPNTSCPSCSHRPLLAEHRRTAILADLVARREILAEQQLSQALAVREARRKAREESWALAQAKSEGERFPTLGSSGAPASIPGLVTTTKSRSEALSPAQQRRRQIAAALAAPGTKKSDEVAGARKAAVLRLDMKTHRVTYGNGQSKALTATALKKAKAKAKADALDAERAKAKAETDGRHNSGNSEDEAEEDTEPQTPEEEEIEFTGSAERLLDPDDDGCFKQVSLQSTLKQPSSTAKKSTRKLTANASSGYSWIRADGQVPNRYTLAASSAPVYISVDERSRPPSWATSMDENVTDTGGLNADGSVEAAPKIVPGAAGARGGKVERGGPAEDDNADEGKVDGSAGGKKRRSRRGGKGKGAAGANTDATPAEAASNK